MEEKLGLKQSVVLFVGIIITFLVINVVFSPKSKDFAFADTGSLSGYAWSDNIGWVSLNCSNDSSCGTSSYVISVDPVTGNLSGYAWSDNIGWISANSSDVSGCPTAPCTPNLQNGVMTGWLRALANGGGWDGWISLSGSGYGVTQSGAALSGYAWGNVVVGWLDFSPVTIPPGCTQGTVYTCSGQNIVQTVTDSFCQQTVTNPYATCVFPAFCSAGSSTCFIPLPTPTPTPGLTGNLQILPTIVSSGDTVKIYWNIDNVTSCTVTGNGDSWTGASSVLAPCMHDGNACVSSPIVGQTTYTLSCAAYAGATPPTFNETKTVNIAPIFEER